MVKLYLQDSLRFVFLNIEFRGVFTVYLTIEFHDKWNKSDLVTNWLLSFRDAGNEKTIELEFQKSADNNN